jgi:lipid-A-disaccharide synthase
LAGIPLVGAYRGNAFEGWLAGKLVKSHSVLLCNLVLGRNIAPEFMQNAATAPALASALMAIIPEGPVREAQTRAFAELDGIMALPDGQASADAAASAALELVANRRKA